MGDNVLPLSESTVVGCEKVGCPWLVRDRMCGLVGQLMARMNSANVFSQSAFTFMRGEDLPPNFDWFVENHSKFIWLGDSCVVSQMNQEQLAYNQLPEPLVLVAGDQEQYEHNADYAISQRHQMLRVTPNDDSRSVLISRVIYSPDFR